MNHRRTPFFWLMALASVALAIWWVLTIPYVPRHMYQVIPARSMFVSAHRDLAGRWDSFSKNPLTRSLMSSLGIQPADLENFGKEPESAYWLKRLASREVVLAYAPGQGGVGRPIWVFASWLGGDSQRLRWSLLLQRISGFSRMKPHRGRICWSVNNFIVQSNESLTITFVEGMLVGCLSRDPRAIYEILDAYDGILPSLANQIDFPSSGPWCADPQAADRGWINLSGLNPNISFKPAEISYELTELTPSSAAGQACGGDPFQNSQLASAQVKPKGLEHLVGNLPLAIGLIQSQMALPLMEGRNNPAWLRIFSELIRDQKAECIMAAVLGDEFSGRMKGVKTPTLIAGVPVNNSTNALAWMKQALDRLNAKYRWGLIPREIEVDGGSLFVLESAMSNFYSMLALDEKPAYAIFGEWLLLSSNMGSLRRLAERFHQMADAPPQEAQWKEDLGSIASPCFVRIDLVRGGKTLRLALTAYGLKLLLEDAKGTLGARQRLNEAKAWIDSLTPLQTCRLWLRSDGQMMKAQFRAGD